MLGSVRKEDPMPWSKHTVEQIITKLLEAEVPLSESRPIAKT
jgi:hypothetical protein